MATKTKATIVQTYLSLLEDNEFDKITVTELVESCSISRQTFYYHFESIEEMLKWAFEEERKAVLKSAKNCPDWISAISKFQSMFEKFNLLFIRAKNSSNLLFIEELLNCAIYQFTVDFYHQYLNFKGEGTEAQKFIVKYNSCAIVGMIFMEMEYDNNFSYEKIFKQIDKTFRN